MKPLAKNTIITFVISILSTVFFAYIFRNHDTNYLGGNLIMIGIFYSAIFLFLIGLSCIVRNGGLFKTLSYVGYFNKRARIRRKINTGELTEKDALGSFTDYVLEKYEKKWSFSHFFIVSAALFFIYAILNFL